MDATPEPKAQPPAQPPAQHAPSGHPRPRACPIHGIALGPLGRCVICQRAESDEPGDPSGGRKALGVLLMMAAALGGMLVYKGATGRPEPPIVVAESAPRSPPPPAAAPAVEERVVIDEARAVTSIKAATEEKQRSFEAAMRKVPVTVYTTKWCELCGAARDWMKSRAFPFNEVDVETAPERLAALRKVNPETTVPTFVIDGEVFVGFGPGTIQGAMFRAAQRRAR